ncbi:MAG: acyl-CoA dehydrogenase family protein [Deltaproteobacteria bacterium]|nr:acyl-CoA dehydrogenase family protein [Deltaproteobacteria bacterium]
MDILQYTEKHNQFRESLRSFLAEEITPNVDQWEKDHIVPKSAWQKMGKAGFLSTSVSPEYGGIGGDFLYSVIVAEEFSRTLHSGLAATLHSDVVVPYIDAFASEELKKKYLPGCVSGDIITALAMTEPDAGSDVAGMKTTAVAEGDEVIINGSKTFISNGIICDLLIIAAKDPSIENKHQAVSLYLIDDGTPGFKRGRQLDKMGWHSQDTAELFFTDCRIPKTNRLGEHGSGFLLLMQKLQQERLMCTLGAVFAAERIMEFAVDYCNKIVVKGKPLVRSQAIQFALVEMTTEVKLGRTFMEKLCADHMEGKNVVIETSMAKYWTTDMVNRIADRCMDICGESAMLESNPIVRAKRDVRVLSIFAGTNEVMKGIAAKFMGM